MAILHDTELTPDEQQKITNNFNETEIETIQSDAILEKQTEYEMKQRRISRTVASTIIFVSCAVIAFLSIATIIFASIFAPQH